MILSFRMELSKLKFNDDFCKVYSSSNGKYYSYLYYSNKYFCVTKMCQNEAEKKLSCVLFPLGSKEAKNLHYVLLKVLQFSLGNVKCKSSYKIASLENRDVIGEIMFDKENNLFSITSKFLDDHKDRVLVCTSIDDVLNLISLVTNMYKHALSKRPITRHFITNFLKELSCHSKSKKDLFYLISTLHDFTNPYNVINKCFQSICTKMSIKTFKQNYYKNFMENNSDVILLYAKFMMLDNEFKLNF